VLGSLVFEILEPGDELLTTFGLLAASSGFMLPSTDWAHGF